jgi:hypothetical protein
MKKTEVENLVEKVKSLLKIFHSKARRNSFKITAGALLCTVKICMNFSVLVSLVLESGFER